MPAEDVPSRGPERCSVHHGSQAVARCDGCDRPMCLACSTPVRGKVFGVECLPAAVGPDAPMDRVPDRDPAGLARRVVRLAFAWAIAATVLPWSRFGAGSEPFGAWSGSPRWSMVAAVAAAVGLAASIARHGRRESPSRLDVAAVVAAVAVVLGSAMALMRPPSFTQPWLGPWVTLVAGLVAVVAAAMALRRTGEREAVRI